jgi:type IV pilus assembly protein PilM
MSSHAQPGSVTRTSWLASPPPSAAVEVSSTRVTVVAVSPQAGGTVVSGYAAEALPAGAVEPSLNAVNVHDAAALAAAVRAALDRVSPRPRRIALILPDTVAKVSLVRFDKVPARPQDLDQLIRWQVRKATPFRVEDASLSWVPGIALDGGGREFIVTAARRDVIASYESACEASGAHAGIVDLASFNLINTVLSAMRTEAQGDWLLVHIGTDYATLAVVRGSDLVFFRNRAAVNPAELTDLVHQTAMYHEDRLGGGGFSRVIMAGAALGGQEQADRIRQRLEERLGTTVTSIDFRGAVPIHDRIGAGPELLDALAPALGVLLRERVA